MKNLQAMSKRLIQEGKPRRRRARGGNIKTTVEFSVEVCRSVSKSTGFQCISQPGDTHRTKFKSHRYNKTCSKKFTAELVLRTIFSVNQLSIYGAVADMCEESACIIFGCLENTGKLVGRNKTIQNCRQRTKRLGRMTKCKAICEQKFAILPNHLQLIKLCSNVGITKTVATGQYFTTFDDAGLDNFGVEGGEGWGGEGLMSKVFFFFETTQPPK